MQLVIFMKSSLPKSSNIIMLNASLKLFSLSLKKITFSKKLFILGSSSLSSFSSLKICRMKPNRVSSVSSLNGYLKQLKEELVLEGELNQTSQLNKSDLQCNRLCNYN